jgi:hypothetical protein
LKSDRLGIFKFVIYHLALLHLLLFPPPPSILHLLHLFTTRQLESVLQLEQTAHALFLSRDKPPYHSTVTVTQGSKSKKGPLRVTVT